MRKLHEKNKDDIGLFQNTLMKIAGGK